MSRARTFSWALVLALLGGSCALVVPSTEDAASLAKEPTSLTKIVDELLAKGHEALAQAKQNPLSSKLLAKGQEALAQIKHQAGAEASKIEGKLRAKGHDARVEANQEAAALTKRLKEQINKIVSPIQVAAKGVLKKAKGHRTGKTDAVGRSGEISNDEQEKVKAAPEALHQETPAAWPSWCQKMNLSQGAQPQLKQEATAAKKEAIEAKNWALGKMKELRAAKAEIPPWMQRIADAEHKGFLKWAVKKYGTMKAAKEEVPQWLMDVAEHEAREAHKWAACKRHQLLLEGEKVPKWMEDQAKEAMSDASEHFVTEEEIQAAIGRSHSRKRIAEEVVVSEAEQKYKEEFVQQAKREVAEKKARKEAEQKA